MRPRRILLGLGLSLVGLSEQGEIEGSMDFEECLNLALKRHDRGNDGNSARKALTKNFLVVLEPRTFGLVVLLGGQCAAERAENKLFLLRNPD